MIVELDHEASEYRQRPETAAEADHLRHQAEILALARHPGVVELLGWDGTTLRLGRLTADRPADTTTAAVVAATTIADLHDLGIAHRDLRPEHLLWDDSGAPVWCGFGKAIAGIDPSGPDAALDVARLVAVLAPLVPGDPDRQRVLAGAARRPGRFAARRLSQRLAAPTSPGPLTLLWAPLKAWRPSFWPQPRVLAATTDHTLAPATLGVAKTRGEGDRNWPHLHRGGRAIAAMAVVAGAAVLWTVAARAAGGGRHGSGPAVAPPPAAPAPHPAVAPAPAAPAPHPVAPPAAAPAPHPTPALAPAADCPPVDLGCGPLPDPGGVVAVAAGRYRIGEPGDIVVVGRWGCRDAVPALLRPASGEVWVFSSWAHGGTTVAARLLTSVPGAATLRVEAGNDGCDTLAVVGAGNLKVAINAGTAP